MITYKCCKTKQFIHYVCVKCGSVFHKACVLKCKSNFKFIKENKIVCCEEDSYAPDLNEGNSELLEKTIHELMEDSELKNNYIQKLKYEHQLFLEEAMKREEEQNDLLTIQKNTIQELNMFINKLKKTLSDKTEKPANTIFVQTNPLIKENVSTETESSKLNLNIHSKRNKNSVDNIDPSIIVEGINNNNRAEKINATMTKTAKLAKKKRILLLSDDKNINWQIRELLDLSVYEVLSVKKPGALLHQVMENIEIMTKNYSLDDFVIITGGFNDINLKNTPSFRSICKKLKMCTHTNILFTSIPYIIRDDSKYKHINKHINKYNAKLNDFLTKFNKCTEGLTQYVEVNNKNYINYKLVASSIKNIILNKNTLSKTLTFIKINTRKNSNLRVASEESEILNVPTINELPLSIELNDAVAESVIEVPLTVELSESHFLCPGQPLPPVSQLC